MTQKNSKQKELIAHFRQNEFTEKDIETLVTKSKLVEEFCVAVEFEKIWTRHKPLLCYGGKLMDAKNELESLQVPDKDRIKKLVDVFWKSWYGWLDEMGKQYEVTDEDRHLWRLFTESAGIDEIVWLEFVIDMIENYPAEFKKMYNELQKKGIVIYKLLHEGYKLDNEESTSAKLGKMSWKEFGALLLTPARPRQPFPPGHDYWKLFKLNNATEAKELGIQRFIELANNPDLRDRQLKIGLIALRNRENNQGKEKTLINKKARNKAVDNGVVHKEMQSFKRTEVGPEKKGFDVEDPSGSNYIENVQNEMLMAQLFEIVKGWNDPKDRAVVQLYYDAIVKDRISVEKEYTRNKNKYQALGLPSMSSVKQRFHRLRKKYPTLENLKEHD